MFFFLFILVTILYVLLVLLVPMLVITITSVYDLTIWLFASPLYHYISVWHAMI